MEQIRLPKESIRFLTEQMTGGVGDDGEKVYDCTWPMAQIPAVADDGR